MQSDEEDFEETLETLSPDRKIQSPGDRFPLRRTPARKESKTAQSKMEEQNLFEKLTKRSTAATSNTSAAGFAFGGMSSSSYYETAEPSSDQKNYTSKEKADRLQEMKDEEAKVEREFPNELFDFCGAETNVEEVRLIDIPYNKGKTREEEENILNCVKVNELRKARAKIYASITRGEKTLMKMVRSTDEGDWEIFHRKMKGSFDTLTQIMDYLQMIGFEKTKGEDEKYLGCK
jgi:ATPase subunit of ABC transporter with duplicated ATPase domains